MEAPEKAYLSKTEVAKILGMHRRRKKQELFFLGKTKLAGGQTHPRSSVL